MQTITPSPLRWLEWAREIQALAQIGANYALNDFQTQRYQRLVGYRVGEGIAFVYP